MIVSVLTTGGVTKTQVFATLYHFPVLYHQLSTWTNEHRGINYSKKCKCCSYFLFLWSRYLGFCTFTHPEANFNLYSFFFFKCCELTPTFNIKANHQSCFSTDANHWMTPMRKAQTCSNFKQDFWCMTINMKTFIVVASALTWHHYKMIRVKLIMHSIKIFHWMIHWLNYMHKLLTLAVFPGSPGLELPGSAFLLDLEGGWSALVLLSLYWGVTLGCSV